MLYFNASFPYDVTLSPSYTPYLPYPSSRWTLGVEVRIVLYIIIFVCSVVGNSLVILTLAQNRRMRTLTNILLLNLSVSDLLLALFCMPFTLIPTILRTFIFGKAMCVLVRYMQGVSVGVSVFTLVAISLERFFAICRPLSSRSWQTVSHSYRIIVCAWAASAILMTPVAVNQRVRPLKNGTYKCMEVWNHKSTEKAYSVILDIMLLVLPLCVMIVAYGLISYTLWPKTTGSSMLGGERGAGRREGGGGEAGGSAWGIGSNKVTGFESESSEQNSNIAVSGRHRPSQSLNTISRDVTSTSFTLSSVKRQTAAPNSSSFSPNDVCCGRDSTCYNNQRENNRRETVDVCRNDLQMTRTDLCNNSSSNTTHLQMDRPNAQLPMDTIINTPLSYRRQSKQVPQKLSPDHRRGIQQQQQYEQLHNSHLQHRGEGHNQRAMHQLQQRPQHSAPLHNRHKEAQQQSLRQSSADRCVLAKRRVVKMLFVVVIEFFICWTPTYILQTWLVFDYSSASANVTPLAMNLTHLLAFLSSCCHPVTYCFMNATFRRGFATVFRRCCCCRRRCAPRGMDGRGPMATETATERRFRCRLGVQRHVDDGLTVEGVRSGYCNDDSVSVIDQPTAGVVE